MAHNVHTLDWLMEWPRNKQNMNLRFSWITLLAAVLMPTSTHGQCGISPKLVGDWETMKQYPLSVLEAQGAIIGDDFVVISGFTNGVSSATNQNYALDLTNSNANWRRIADLPVKDGITHGAFVVVGTKFYMCGGYLGGHPGPHVATCLMYDHAQNKWSTFASLPDGRAGGGMTYNKSDNSLFFTAGAERPKAPLSADAVDYQQSWKYYLDEPGQGWIVRKNIPFKTNHMSYYTTLNGKRHFFLAGQVGENEHTGNVAFNYEYVQSSNSWVKKKDMPFTRGHASSSTNAVKCGLIIAGGSTNEFGKTSDISYYDVSRNNWNSVGDLPMALNTPVCDIHYLSGYYYCFTGNWSNPKLAHRIKIEV